MKMTEPRNDPRSEPHAGAADDLAGLEVFFTAARQAPPAASPEFLARVLTDAQTAFDARPQATAATRPEPHRLAQQTRSLPRPLATLFGLIGGWRGMGGLVTAAAAGLWIGFAGSDRLVQVATGVSAQTTNITAEIEDDATLLAVSDILALAGQ